MKLPAELIKAIDQRDHFDPMAGIDPKRRQLEAQAAGIRDQLRNGVDLRASAELGQTLAGLNAAISQRPPYFPETDAELNKRRYGLAVAVSRAATRFHQDQTKPLWEKVRQQYEALVDVLDEVGRHRAELAEEVRGVVGDELEIEVRRIAVDMALVMGLEPRRMGPVEREQDRQHREDLLARKQASKVVEPPMSSALARSLRNGNLNAIASHGREKGEHIEVLNSLNRAEKSAPSVERRREIRRLRQVIDGLDRTIASLERGNKELAVVEEQARKREAEAEKRKAEAAKAAAR